MVERISWHRRDFLKCLSVFPAAWMGLGRDDAMTPRLVFSCSASNDLYELFASASYPRYESAHEAVSRSASGSGVLILAQGYPGQATELSLDLFREAAEKKLRLYIEFPSFVPGLQVGAPSAIAKGRYGNLFERILVTSDAFGSSLEKLSLLDFHDGRYVPVSAGNAILSLARVAGFDKAVYGIPDEGVHPILFRAPEGDVLVSTTKLSQFITGRYAPVQSWTIVWNWILEWLQPEAAVRLGKYQPAVRPSFGPREALPANAEFQAFTRGVAWYRGANLFVHPSWEKTVEERAALDSPSLGPAPDWPVGDGSAGLLEGFSTIIEPDGRQLLGWRRRNDCMGETSMAMALSSAVSGSARDGAIAANLNDFIYRSPLAQGPRNDPKSPSYGLVGWELPKGLDAYWGDDNARSALGTLATAALLKTDRWDEAVLRCLLANFRTTGKLGFREDRLDEEQLQTHGWRHFYDAENVNYAPHYQAYPWATYLWSWQKTRYAGFLERAKTAVRMTMAAYPNQWRWTNGIQQERARMLLPLAWLVRVEDTPEHRGWLRQMADALLALQAECGALREEIGAVANGGLPPPKSNAAYGKSEAPLIQENGDPVCDLLYTSNFAFLGLHEAAAATGDPYYARAGDRLAELFCRIQVRSSARPELDGGWMRAFDYKRWNYWGSDSDDGWGVWSVETGWTQSWITSVLALRHLKTSYWDLTADSKIGRQMDRLLSVMLLPA
ncbi:MAG: hypothetical protein V4587_10455 [Acidobacteriota bacterium]